MTTQIQQKVDLILTHFPFTWSLNCKVGLTELVEFKKKYIYISST